MTHVTNPSHVTSHVSRHISCHVTSRHVTSRHDSRPTSYVPRLTSHVTSHVFHLISLIPSHVRLLRLTYLAHVFTSFTSLSTSSSRVLRPLASLASEHPNWVRRACVGLFWSVLVPKDFWHGKTTYCIWSQEAELNHDYHISIFSSDLFARGVRGEDVTLPFTTSNVCGTKWNT